MGYSDIRVSLFLLLSLVVSINGQSLLNPPSFNIATDRRIFSSATCGEGDDIEGPEPKKELYCKLVGANWHDNINKHIFQGQACDYCDSTDPQLAHKAEFAIDGTERWWQSPPLSRGVKYNEVNLTIDLGQEFHVAYVFIKMANSPRPGVWILERSKDYGKTYTPWQFFADGYDDCQSIFGVSTKFITRDDSVICETKFSKTLPLENGEIAVSLLNGRPSAENFSYSQVLQEFTKATNVRLRLLRPKTTLAHLISIAKQDPTVTRRYFYSIKDINIGGRCVCNGHANSCDVTDPSQPQKLNCKCQHNTCGSQCEICCPGFVQKAWKPATVDNPNICQPCNCFGHSQECYYDPEVDEKKLSIDINGVRDGGGVCINCQHNTEGINCDRCKDGFHRPFNRPINETDVCEPCDCTSRFHNGSCAEGSGKCFCRENYVEPECDRCAYGFTGFPECKPCDCNVNGTLGQVCELTVGNCPCKPEYTGKQCRSCSPGHFGFPNCVACQCDGRGVEPTSRDRCDITTGQCTCVDGFSGRQCDQCAVGYYNYPSCSPCNCDVAGTTSEICDKSSGKCLCKEGYGGYRCDQCATGYFGFPNCTACDCDPTGSPSRGCSATGKCRCNSAYGGLKCSDCSVGHFKYPECLQCGCDPYGGHGVSCDIDGRCYCKKNFDGEKCNRCREGYYNYPLCEECNCHPAGVVVAFKGCGSVAAGELCKCKERVTGRICNQCKDLYWNLNQFNIHGCEDCKCNRQGTVNSVGNCHGVTGQCICRQNIESRACEQCKPGTFARQEGNLFGCTDCKCDVGGAVNSLCDKYDGQCTCKPKIKGRKCDEPLQTYYIPTLYQHKYEIEDGRTVSDSPARFGYDDNVFPGYSWRGYASFTNIMREVHWNIHVQKPSFYRLIFRYVNNGSDPVAGTFALKAQNPHDDDQSASIYFQPSKEPKTEIAATKFRQINQVLLSQGNYTAILRVDKDILIDFMVLIPEVYYEARLLREEDPLPCRDNQPKGTLCRHYSYPAFPSNVTTIRGEEGKTSSPERGTVSAKKYDDLDLSRRLKADGTMAVIDGMQSNLLIDFQLPSRKVGKHAVVISYHNPSVTGVPVNEPTKVDVKIISNEGQTVETELSLADCPYSFLCRQVVTYGTGEVAPLDLTTTSSILIEPTGIVQNKTLLIESINTIPYNEWSLDFVTPKLVCVTKDQKCVESLFAPVGEGTKIEFERDQNPERIITQNSHSYVVLNNTETLVEMRGRVTTPGRYKFILHYMQPDHPSYDIETVIQDINNEQFFNALTTMAYCPTLSGCRSIVHQSQSNSSIFYITENFSLTIRSPPGKSLLLDYVLAIPVDAVDDNTMGMMAQDRAYDFIAECGENAFDITTNSSEFCKKSVFSLTADYNGMAFPCKCSVQGSKSYECDPFGGQCLCKPNVIGRQCTRCKTGYYGFPDCKQCNCPSTAYCHPRNGKCICPPKVTGEKCDTCMVHTYGFDEYLGCEECDCHSRGVVKLPNGKADLQCNITTGQCPCRPTIVGRKCDQCMPGYAYFPHCQLCTCDLRGVADEICDQENANCFCKENVRGESCDICAPDAFNLEESNPDGCTKCFCFGTTDRCRSSTLFKSFITDMKSGWNLFSISTDDKVLDLRPVSNALIDYLPEGSISATIPQDDSTSRNNYYMSVPKSYLGKRITSYGGNFSYLVENLITTSQYSGTPLAFDLILTGSNLTIGYQQDEQPDEPNSAFGYNITIIERHFRHLNRNPVTREQIMMVLVKLDAIFVRVSYFRPARTLNLHRFTMEAATTNQTNLDQGGAGSASAIAKRVEQCYCPKNYKGPSCEECNNGYYRAKAGPYLGFCVPCQCNGHSDECDVETGKCFNCKHNTHGDHCEFCDEGYYGNATKGNPYDCLICPCPRPDVSNNFATSCEVSEDGLQVSCKCKPGYVEPRCDYCAAGFHGKPYELGDYCKPCQCNENIDPNNPASCDSITGECQLCLNNTFGPACELCAPGYYGDAIVRKDCKTCACDTCGTQRCDPFTGKCECKPNIVGEHCDQCKKDHFGIGTCKGCEQCDCGNASLSTGCDPYTGQCQCAPGVGGRTCDHCEAGYWKYSPDGCTSCNCGKKYSYGAVCDQETGQCQCLTGVVGKNCDSCPWRWVFIDKVGCRKCDECTHFLLDDTDYMRNVTNQTMNELTEGGLAVFAIKKVDHVKKEIDKHTSLIREFVEKPKVSLSPVALSVSELEKGMTSMDTNTTMMSKVAQKALEEAAATREAALAATDSSKLVITTSLMLLTELRSLEESFNHPTIVQNIEQMVKDAEAYLEHLKNITYETEERHARNEYENSRGILEQSEEFTIPAKTNTKKINGTFDIIDNLRHRLTELENLAKEARMTVIRTEQANAVATDTQEKINNAKSEASRLLEVIKAANADAQVKLASCNAFLSQYHSHSIDMIEGTKQLISKKDRLKVAIKEHRLNPDPLRPIADEAKEHATDLYHKARELERLARGTRATNVLDTVEAAGVYDHIAGNISEALRLAEEGEVAIVGLQQTKNATKENVDASKERSLTLKKEAEELHVQVSNELVTPIDEAIKKVDSMVSSLDRLNGTHEGILKDLSDLKKNELRVGAESAVEGSSAALRDVETVRGRVSVIHDEIEEASKRAEKIPEEYTSIQNDIKSGRSYTERVAGIVPDIVQLIEKVGVKHPKISEAQASLDAKIAEIKKAIATARGLANRIEVGVDVREPTSIQLRNPDNFLQSGIYSKFSMSFKTKENNALLAYIGNPVTATTASRKRRQEDISPSSTEDSSSDTLTGGDFMALEIRNGRVVFTIDLGSGAERTDSSLIVSNDAWHDVVVARIGKNISLLITGQDPTTGNPQHEEAEGKISGRNNVFNVHPSRSRIYVGGIPAGISVQKDIQNTQLKSGQVANVVYGDTPLGLWNFVEGESNDKGAEQRQIISEIASTGMRFDGKSYVILSKNKFNFEKETFVQLKFKTFAREGLLFLIGDSDEGELNQFLSIHMMDTRIFLTFDLGSGYVHLASPEGRPLNDGKWHKVEVARKEREGILKIDEREVDFKDAIGISVTLSTTDKIYVGGFPKAHNLPFAISNFEGCIEDLQIENLKIDLSNNIEASPKVVKGCPHAVSRDASFASGVKGFVEMPLESDINSFISLSFKYRTMDKSGLLFYVANEDHTSSITLYLNEYGQVVLRTEPGGEVVSTRNSYYGEHWHYVVASKDSSRLSLEVDDEFDDVAKAQVSSVLNIYNPEQLRSVYFGGLPPDQVYILAGKSIPTYFSGCFGDMTLNGILQNFATSSNRPGASLASCPLSVVVGVNQSTPTAPGSETPTVTDSSLDVTTSVTVEGCSIPLNPARDLFVPVSEGLRFGNALDTRNEFNVNSAVTSSFLEECTFEIEFKTTATEGVILYVTAGKQIDFLTIYILEGKVYFAWNNGGGQGVTRREESVNDGQWHKVSVYRKRKAGSLKVDEGTEIWTTSLGDETALNVKSPVFVGGLSDDISKGAKTNLKNVVNSFPGCLRNFKIQGVNQDFSKDSIAYGSTPCSSKVEPGVFFHSTGGHVILKDKFRVGERIKIDLKIKPRSPSGLLLTVFERKVAKGDFLILQIVNGAVKFTVDNGGGPFSVVQTPERPLCDGEWHTIQAIKERNIITLSLDNRNIEISMGTGGISSTDTNDPLFLGGVPEGDNVPGLETKERFVGCISDIKIGDRMQSVSTAIVNGDVTLNSCPTT